MRTDFRGFADDREVEMDDAAAAPPRAVDRELQKAVR